MKREVAFDDVSSADLVVDAVYRGGANLSREPLHAMFKCGIGGGFRYKRREDKSLRFVVLFTTEADADWPDRLDMQTGLFVYYGDNRRPGELHKTKRGGNAILRDVFTELQAGEPDRSSIPPFFVFTRGLQGHDVIFRGLAAPGATATSPMEQLVAVWKISNGQRFQNYRALFTVLRAGEISRTWIDDLLADGDPLLHAPEAWHAWANEGTYKALAAARSISHRKRDEQLPRDGLQRQLVHTILDAYRDDSVGFERFAAEFFQMTESNVEAYELTRPWRDGGRDALGLYRIGHLGDSIDVEFALEAKCYAMAHAVGVREVSRLISRLRHRQFGVLVTTSYVHDQAYREIKDDLHPVLVISGRDIADGLIENGFSTPESVQRFISDIGRYPY